MDIKTSDGTVDAREIMEYRVSTIAASEKPVAWHRHGSEGDEVPAVYQKFGIVYNEGQAIRKTKEWEDEAANFAADYQNQHNVDISSHLAASKERPGRNGGIKKVDFEGIGRTVVGALEANSEPMEDDGEEHHTTLEWIEQQMPAVVDALKDTAINLRPIKPKKTPVISKQMNDAKERARAQGLSEEVVEQIFRK